MVYRAYMTGDAYNEKGDHMERELEKAYREGYEHGKHEARGGMHERSNYPHDGGYYGERHDGYWDDELMERRGVRGTGRYSRYRYRS